MENKIQYIGPYKIFGVQKEDFTTPAGGEVVKVLFESSIPQIMPLRTFQMLISPEPVPLDKMQEKKISIVVEALKDVCLEYDLTSLESEFMLIRFANTLKNIVDKAGHLLFTKELYGTADNKGWTKGANFSEQRTLLEAHSICQKLANDTESKTIGEKEAGK